MNLNKERSRQKLQDVLESVELTDKNSRLAEQYLDVDLEEDRELLAGAEPQDFSELRQEVRDKCREYKSYCLKRNLKEELGRFVRFAASVGGSTAYYVLAPDRYNIVDINSILEVEVKVLSTQAVKKQVFRGRDVDMTDEEIQERLKTLSYLKIHPRDREENKYLLLRGERVYEESIGDKRAYIEAALHKYEKALDTYDQGIIEEAKKEFKEFLEELEEF